MVICPNCKNEIEYEYYECSRKCTSNDIWWCENCGAIQICYNGELPEKGDWEIPKNTS